MRHRPASAALGALLASPAAWAGGDGSHLLDLDLEALLDQTVVVASRGEQRRFDASAAVHVIDREQLRRSGALRLPDALRLVPGLHVGKWDANKWAISSRSSMGRFSSTMLVLVDGRPAYTPLFGGVRWETLDLPLDSIERIEVVRGPGGPLWGANAVDGVVSIVTRHSADTLGQRVSLLVGEGDLREAVEARWGARLGEWTWRLDARYDASDAGLRPPIDRSAWTAPRDVGQASVDTGQFRTLMLRADSPGDAASRWQLSAGRRSGGFFDERLVLGLPQRNANGFALGFGSVRWTTAPAEGQSLQVQANVQALRVADAAIDDRQHLSDLDVQHAVTVGRHRWTWGVGYWHYRSDTRTPARFSTPPCMGCFGADPGIGGDTKRSVFVQDEVALSPQWLLTAGAKAEKARGLDWDLQPTLRLRWQPDARHTLWAGATRVLRSSTRLERDGVLFNVPDGLRAAFGCRTLADGLCRIGDPDLPPWRVRVLEAGWRAHLADAVAIDTTVFRNGFSDSPPNGILQRWRARGAEVAVTWQPSSTWTIEANGAWHDVDDRRRPTDTPEPANMLPERRGALRIAWSPRPDVDLDVRGTWVSGRRNAGSARIRDLPGYARLDARLGWSPAPGWGAALILRNALDAQPVEYLEGLRTGTAVPRGIAVQIDRTWP